MGFYFVQGDGALEEFFERGGFAVSNAARDDQIEVAQIGGDVVGEAVGSDPAADVDADGSEFFFRGSGLDPDARFTRDAIRGNTEVGGGTDHRFFEGADIPANIAFDFVEIEDGITDDLAWTVICDVTAATGDVEFDFLLTKDVFGG